MDETGGGQTRLTDASAPDGASGPVEAREKAVAGGIDLAATEAGELFALPGDIQEQAAGRDVLRQPRKELTLVGELELQRAHPAFARATLPPMPPPTRLVPTRCPTRIR